MIVAGLRNLLHMASLQFRLPTQCSSLFSAYGIAPISFADAMQQLVFCIWHRSNFVCRRNAAACFLHMASLQFRLPTQCSSLFSAYGIAPISFADAMQQLVLRLANLHAQRLFAKAGEKKNQSEVQGQLTCFECSFAWNEQSSGPALKPPEGQLLAFTPDLRA